MHVRYLFISLMFLVSATSAQAQFHERWHERFREHRGFPPSFVVPEPRRADPEAHALVHRHPAGSGQLADGPVCDNPDNDPDAAIAACGRIIARGPIRNGYSVVLAYIHRGQAYEDKADHDHAIADFSQAIQRESKVPGYFAMRGAAAEKAGDLNAARGDFRQAMSLDAKNQDALNGLKRVETRSAATTAGGGATPPAPIAAAQLSTPITPAATSTSVAAAPVVVTQPPPPVAPLVVASAAVPAVSTPPVTGAESAAPGPRVALVIGNGAYANANVLPNPPNDAHAIADVLRSIGFDVVEGENLNHAAMVSDLREFLHKAASASIVLLFYAGHGMQVDGRNYLVPVDAKLAEASDLPFETIEIDKLLDSLGEPGHTNIILLDACRDNPLARSFASHLPATRSAAVATGLAAYSAVGTGTLIAYATAPGQTALDGQGKDSPFTTSLLHFLPTPGLEIRQMLTRVRAEVAAQTGNRQIPWDNSSLMGDVVLVKPAPPDKTAEH
jgi:tetratricopeptide (TPR) repeat protein